MNARIIGLIYFYVVSAAALMLLVIGIFHSVNLVVNLLAYDQYPLPYAGQDCNSIKNIVPAAASSSVSSLPIAPIPGGATPSAEQLQKQVDDCVSAQVQERKQQKISDIKDAITFTLVGLVLFLIHFPIARKMSAEK